MAATVTEVLSVREAIEGRHSIRRYQPEPIPRAHLDEILRQASLAPSANNLQPWRFHVVTDPDQKLRLQEAAFGQKQVGMAAAVILVCSDMEDVLENIKETVHPGMGPERIEQEAQRLRQRFEQQSVEQRGKWGAGQSNIAMGFLMLAARGMGYGTVPMLGFDPAKVRELLGLPDHVQFAGMLPIGVPAEDGYPHHRHPLERIVTYH